MTGANSHLKNKKKTLREDSTNRTRQTVDLQRKGKAPTALPLVAGGKPSGTSRERGRGGKARSGSFHRSVPESLRDRVEC
ncbi:hypothetical protein E2562_015941 [Oryza meyeriana var. granulata]|uniref:Uncharacterized protein n=1 Tax=Oryza meyeriana var. granulata TaxID=110450 RepID=A0A6G1CF86_9ORYZ|nr:hypothetical protein E2562_015941 [Oryza meyeriana var. granulata]